MNLLYKVVANIIFCIHFLIVLIVLFGWIDSRMWSLYIIVLTATLISDILLGYCILSKWEFNLRKKIDPNTNYNFKWATYYTYKITNHRISDSLYKNISIVFILLSIGVSLCFRFM